MPFDLAEGRPLTIDGFLGAVREHLKVLVTNIGDLTSYSFRRVSATVSALAERSEPEKIALGGWIDRGTGSGHDCCQIQCTEGSSI